MIKYPNLTVTVKLRAQSLPLPQILLLTQILPLPQIARVLAQVLARVRLVGDLSRKNKTVREHVNQH